MTADFDVAICGGGPVGLALAAMLARRGMPAARIALIDAKPVEQASRDPRSIAVSHGSRQLLEAIGAWPATDVAPIETIHVSRHGRFGRTLIDCADYDVPALGYVTRYGTLVHALAAAAARHPVTLFRPAQVAGLTEQADGVTLQLADGRALTAGIAVQAEGGLFGEQAQRALQRDYAQTAVIAHVDVSVPLAGRAFERFTDEGPLALLPQPAPDTQDGRYALVWCCRPATAERLLTLSDAGFLDALQQAFGTRLGRFTQVSARVGYPLGLNAHAAGSARTVAIGNAAQTLHPVAGQGFNLGLRDAAVLARMLAQDASPAQLAHYASQRRTDRGLTIRLTDTMARVFAGAPGRRLPQAMLGLSLGMIDMLPAPKGLLAEIMMFGHRA